MIVDASDVIRINQAAQGLLPMAEIEAWFEQQRKAAQRALITVAGQLALQAGALPSDAAAAAQYARLKPGIPASVLMGKGVPKVQFEKVQQLPDEESLRSFSFLVGLLSVADARRRRTKCAEGCRHWWHRDLSDRSAVNDILESGEAGALYSGWL